MTRRRLADAVDDQRRVLRSLREDVAIERQRLDEERDAVTRMVAERWALDDALRDVRRQLARALRDVADDLDQGRIPA